MATLDAISVAFDMDSFFGFIFEPEPLATLEPVSETNTSVTLLTQSIDGRLFLLQTDFFLSSQTSATITGFTISETNGTPVAVASNLNLVIDANADPEDLLDQFSLSTIFSGVDFFDGSELDDLIFGFGGDDTIIGRGGNDQIYGNQGNDAVYGNLGNDTIFGGQGFDGIFGGQGDDLIYGNFQDDAIYGNFGNDTLFGGQDQDVLFGGQDDDILRGNLGNDTLIGNRGNDQNIGGPGADTFVFGPNSGNDVVLDFENNLDRVNIAGTGANLSQQGADSLITLNTGDTVLVLNITVEELTDDVFFV